MRTCWPGQAELAQEPEQLEQQAVEALPGRGGGGVLSIGVLDCGFQPYVNLGLLHTFASAAEEESVDLHLLRLFQTKTNIHSYIHSHFNSLT